MAAVPLAGIRITKQLEAAYKMKTRDFEMKQRDLEVDIEVDMVNGADYIVIFISHEDELTALADKVIHL